MELFLSGAVIERLAESLVLGFAARPLIAHACSREFRGMAPGLAWLCRTLLVSSMLLVALAAVLGPAWVLRGMAAFGLAALVGSIWITSPSRGRSLRWPRGSLEPMSLDYWFSRSYFLDRFRRYGCPFKACQYLRPTVCIVGLEQGFELLRRHEADLAVPPLPFDRFIPGGFLRYMSPERHRTTKQILQQIMVRDVFVRNAPLIRKLLRLAVARLDEASALDEGGGEAPRPHIQRVLFLIWMKIFFGIEPSSVECLRLKSLFRVIDFRNPLGASDDQVHAALAEISRIVGSGGTATDPDYATDSFLAMLAHRFPGQLENPTIRFNLIYISHSSWADVSGLLQWVFRQLTDHPFWADRLRAELRDCTAAGTPTAFTPQTPASESAAFVTRLADRIVQETLRLEQSEQLYRVSSRDIPCGESIIPRGWLVRICLRESHQNPHVFERPASFNPDRFLNRSYSRTEYAPFGAGMKHACLGEELSRLVAAIFAEELVGGRSWHSVVEAPPEYGPWRHWRPGSAWRVAATAVA
jgi:cytochrome P450